MGNAWLITALIVFAYILGLATGWVIWRLAKHPPSQSATAGERIASVLSRIGSKTEETEFAANGKHDAPEDLKLDALDAEIKEARAILEADNVEQEALTERLAEVDAAVKRANGRLKLVLKSIQNAKNNL